MKIAHIIPHSIGYPLESHNGRYEWVYSLALLQSAAGHEVTIYGSPHSQVPGVTTQGITDASGDVHENNTETFRLAFSGDHDIFHSHFDALHYEVAHETTKPIVFTQHWWPTDQLIATAKSHPSPNVWAVPPTRFMLAIDQTSDIQTKGFIYHGIDLEKFSPSGIEKSERLLFVSRIAPEKNVDIAIAAAKRSGRGLDIVGKVAAKNQDYWKSLEPLIDGEAIRYLGPKPQSELVSLYSQAYGVLCPYDINEPFGLVSIEAQACGAPLIMKRGGSRGELLEEDVTGFLCETEDEFVEAIGKLASIKPDECVRFAQKFDIHEMAKNYEQLYKELATN